MKKNKLFRLASALSVLGISSLVISSCSQGVDKKENPTKPIVTNPSDQPNPNGGTNPGNSNQPSKPNTESDKLKELIKTLNASSFKLIDTTNNSEVDLSTVEAQAVKDSGAKYKFELKETSGIPSGWTTKIRIGDADTKKGRLEVNVEFTKDANTSVKSESSIVIDGFKSLSTSVKSALITSTQIGGAENQTNKMALNVGDVKFAKLTDINKPTALQTQESQPAVETRSSSRLLEDDQASSIMTNGFQSAFAETFKEGGVNKTAADKIKESESSFNADDLYLTGSATIDSLWQNDDKSVSFYLTSKEANNPLKLKSKSSEDLEVIIPGIVVKNIIPDDVEISISKVDVENVKFNPQNQSNLEAYNQIIAKQEGDGDKYKVVDNQLFATVNNKDYKINPIHIPYIPQKSNHKILFKARYIFDGKVVNNDFWTAKIAFKKITQNSNLYSSAVQISELSDEKNKLTYFNSLTDENPSGQDVSDRFFWMGAPNSVTETNMYTENKEIEGQENSDSGNGVAQMVNWKENSNSDNSQELLDSNKDIGSNYILYTRVKYTKASEQYGYSWSNQVTLLHIDTPDPEGAEE
ncbi:hypothetical protein [Mycoplasma sp. E35C]|uniref:hypothetical protein n=1 Tax=Mycoplasma sp. E35C TaxID=2801918 RepID=UPI001CA3B201|nr:hypothetical protein [Mycoplasma sp. E35C]QZX49131.1 hypothetical protein JJE79_03710 [Mycoplasma sp. E35C]